MMTIDMFERAGAFAENKDIARGIRVNELLPALEKHEPVTLNFERVSSTTQSFVHALISDAIRKHGIDVLDDITFKDCNDNVKQLIKIVAEYMQQGAEREPEEA